MQESEKEARERMETRADKECESLQKWPPLCSSLAFPQWDRGWEGQKLPSLKIFQINQKFL